MPVTAAGLLTAKSAALGARRGPAPLTSPTLAQLAVNAGVIYGSAIAYDRMNDLDYAKYVFHEIGQAVTENDFSPANIQATQGVFNYTTPQAILTKCQALGIPLVGHYLIHAPDAPLSWMSALTPSTALAALQATIAGPVGHFAGQMDSYVVVNECLKGFGTTLAGGYVPNIWTTLLGVAANGVPIYIQTALTQARSSDPAAKLILNFDDCETSQPSHITNKAQILTLLRALQAANVPIDGIGMESHLPTTALTDLVIADLLAFLNAVQALGLFVDITELDLADSSQSANQTTRDAQDAAIFAAYIGTIAAHPAVRAIRSWEISDRDNWLTRGFGAFFQRSDHLTLRTSLLDGAYRIKPSYTAVANAFRAAAAAVPSTGPGTWPPTIGVTTASITFTDSQGQVTIPCPTPNGCGNWMPEPVAVGAPAVQYATGQEFVWPTRIDYCVSFEFGPIPAFYGSAIQRLKLWLDQGGTVLVNTADDANRAYTCCKRSGSKVTYRFDRQLMEYTLLLSLKNLAQAPMVCVYDPIYVGTAIQ